MSEPNEEFLTAEEAADRLQVTRSYLYRLIKRGVLPEAIGIRNGREVKLIPAAALNRLNAPEGLLVRDVTDQVVAGPARPANDPTLTGPSPWPRPQVTAPSPPVGSVTGQSYAIDLQMALLGELRTELESLRRQLAAERTARQELERGLAQPREAPAEASHELASAISRANEVTALVKASEIKHQRFFEQFLEQQKWGRAKRIAYVTYLAIASAAGVAIIIWIFRLAHQFEALLAR